MELSENDAMSTTNGTTNRRQSGRAVRAPEKFVPDAQPGTTSNGKRKRGGDNGEEDVENEEDEEEDEETEEESTDEEEATDPRKRSKTAKKPAAKKPKVNGTDDGDDAPAASAVKLPNRSKKSKKVIISDPKAEGLYGKIRPTQRVNTILITFIADIFTSGKTSEEVAVEWLDKYDADNTASMMDLVNCVLKSTGCDIKITEDDINDPDNVPNRLGDIQEEYKDVRTTFITSDHIDAYLNLAKYYGLPPYLKIQEHTCFQSLSSQLFQVSGRNYACQGSSL